MRRLTQSERDDQGVATILLICVMAALLSAAGLAIDVSHNVFEARAAQNSADATVLAVATDCAAGTALGSYTPYYKPTSGQTINTPSCVSDEPNTAKITVAKSVSGFLSGDHTLNRNAGASWGSIGSANTAPAVLSQCTFDSATNYGTTFPSAEVIIPLGGGGPACLNQPPGAFGWLDTSPAGGCSINTTLNSSGQLVVHGIPGTGNGDWWNCITQVGVNGTMMVPIYGAACFGQSPCVQNQNDANGTNLWYLILGFAEIQVTGWNLKQGTPPKAGTPTVTCPPPGSNSCIRGRFVRFATQLGSPGPGGPFGVQVVYLSS